MKFCVLAYSMLHDIASFPPSLTSTIVSPQSHSCIGAAYFCSVRTSVLDSLFVAFLDWRINKCRNDPYEPNYIGMVYCPGAHLTLHVRIIAINIIWKISNNQVLSIQIVSALFLSCGTSESNASVEKWPLITILLAHRALILKPLRILFPLLRRT